MSSTFTGLNISSRGLMVSQTSLYVSNANISNAETDGYSRQTVNQVSGNYYSNGLNYAIGNSGPQIDSIVNLEDFYLNTQYWHDASESGQWEIKSELLTEMEYIIGEPNSYNISNSLMSFTNALEEVSKNPNSEPAKASLVQFGVALSETISNTYTDMASLLEDQIEILKYKIDEINGLTQEIANLNAMIINVELSGSNANELKDQQGLLIDQLSTLTDIKVEQVTSGNKPNGEPVYTYQIASEGTLLVSGDNHYDLVGEVVGGEPDSMVITSNGKAYAPTSGELGAYYEVANSNGENGSFKGIPYYLDELSTFTNGIVEAFNSAYSNGYNAYGETGLDFFIYDQDSSGELSVSQELIEDPSKLLIAGEMGEDGNSDGIKSCIDVFNASDVIENTSIYDYLNAIVLTLGTDGKFAGNRLEVSESLLLQMTQSRLSLTSVSIDEEMSDVVLYQQTYSAAAKMINVWDEIYQTMINELG